jgi:hypothetical protein
VRDQALQVRVWVHVKQQQVYVKLHPEAVAVEVEVGQKQVREMDVFCNPQDDHLALHQIPTTTFSWHWQLKVLRR